MSTESRQGQTRYWCHICNAEVNIYMAPDPTCQQCNEQFIEELHSDDDPREFLAGANTDNPQERNGIHLPDAGAAHVFSFSPSTGRVNNLNGEMGDDIFQYFSRAHNAEEDGNNERTAEGNNPSPLGNFVQSLLSNMLGPNVELSTGNENNETGTRPMMFYGSMVDGNMQFQPMPGTMPAADGEENEAGERTGTAANGENGTGRGPNGMRGNTMQSVMQFISAMTGAPMDGFATNPNDYVFSQTALDNIITQLMEQTGGASAPPPAPEEVIDSLKKRPLTDEEKKTETDCAVCKDRFENHEMVIELPCEHIFHDDCIKPWLKLNSTCPVCRHSVLPETASNNNNNERNDHNDSNNNNTQNNSSEPPNDNQNNNNPNATRATFTWTIGGGGNGGDNTQQSSSRIPANISSVFPWTTNLPTSRSNNNNTTNNHGYPLDDMDLD